MPNINTNANPLTGFNSKLFGMGENEEVGWISSNSLVPVAHELGDDPDLAVSQKLLTDSITDMEQRLAGSVLKNTLNDVVSGEEFEFSLHLDNGALVFEYNKRI